MSLCRAGHGEEQSLLAGEETKTAETERGKSTRGSEPKTASSSKGIHGERGPVRCLAGLLSHIPKPSQRL